MVLEVGPGSGVYLPLLADLFENVISSDIEEAYLVNLRSLQVSYPNVELITDDITCSRLTSKSFDLILCSEVIEHIGNSRAVLAEMRRLLKPGGILILSTPQRFSTLEMTAKIAFLPGIIQLVRMIYGESILETGHINLMTEEEVIRQLNTAGFSICESYKSGMYIPFLAEFGGIKAQHFEGWLEKLIRGTKLDWLLWTQYYIAAT